MRTPVISLGAGVQSSTMLLLAARGELPCRPTLAIFADTGREPKAVYRHLEFLREECRGRVEVVTVQQLDLMEPVRGDGFNPVPLYHVDQVGKVSIGQRQCTYQAKLRPLRAELRLRGYGPKNTVKCLLGISTDEIARIKPSGREWVENAWPLVEMEMSRADCEAWTAEQGYPAAPRSACTFCPFHTDAEWRHLRDTDPEGWDEAVEYDRLAQRRGEFVHRSVVPLPMVDLSTPEDRGQLTLDSMDECLGGCFL